MAAAMATTRDSQRQKILQNYDSFTKKCENYLSTSEETAKNIKSFLKALYSEIKDTETEEGLPSGETLPELIVDNFDEEQIWQELELQNEARVDALVGNVAKLVAQKDKLKNIASVISPSKDGVSNEDKENGSDESGTENEAELDEESEIDDDELALIKKDYDDDDDDDDGSEDDYDLPQRDSDDSNIEMDENVISEDDADSGDDDNILKESPNKKSKHQSKGYQKSKIDKNPSVVDDKFFKLSEMEEFLEREERENISKDDDSEDSIDLFEDMTSDESEEDDAVDDNDDSEAGSRHVHYADFFDAPEGESSGKMLTSKSKELQADKKKKVKFNIGGDDLDNEDGSDDGSNSDDSDLQVPNKSEVKSSYEIRQERLQAKIKKLEEEAISDKPWQLKGEISSESRPENALLEEALEFDLTHRPAPVVTEETTHRLEDIIKQRIKDKAWDDVERKEKPVEAPTEFKKKLVLDQEKSKLSLSQVYEQEYLKKVAAAEPDASDKPEEVPKEHVEIKAMMGSLFRKLDALSNFHFTPKQVAPEVKIITNIPAISMEEVAPVATSDATLLAPEEVKAKPKGDVKSKGEKTDTDRKRERRQKKKHQRIVSKEREKREATVAKLNPGLGNKYSKEKAVKLLEKVAKDSNVSLIENTGSRKTVKSSSAFFNQLQDEVTSQMKAKTQQTKKRKSDSKTLSAKRLKL